MNFKPLSELNSLDAGTLIKERTEAKQYLKGIYFENSLGNLKNTSELKKTKRYIARIESIRNARKKTSSAPLVS